MYLFYSDWQGYTEENETYRLHVPIANTAEGEKQKKKKKRFQGNYN